MLRIVYEPLFDDYAFVRPEVTVEFGARSTGEPRVLRSVECDAAPYLPGVLFPRARPSVMLAERTFWEKATAIHVFCLRARGRGDHLSRHWHDLARLDDAGIVAQALADRALAPSVARHKSMFFREKDAAATKSTDRSKYGDSTLHTRAAPFEARGARGGAVSDVRARGSARGLCRRGRGRVAEEGEPVLDRLAGQTFVRACPLEPPSAACAD